MSGFEASFVAALRDPIAAAPVYCAPASRFAIYRNNVAVSLIGTLEARYPAVRRIVGEEFFRETARQYVAESPPRSPVMIEYGEMFPQFLEGVEALAGYPYVPDVARIEQARAHAYHAADAAPIGPAEFAATAPLQLAHATLVLHPSLTVVRSRYSAVTIWSMNAGEEEFRKIGDWADEAAVIVRPDCDVIVRRLPPGGAEFLAALATGRNLGDAMTEAIAGAPDFDLTGNLQGLIETGLACRICLGEGAT